MRSGMMGREMRRASAWGLLALYVLLSLAVTGALASSAQNGLHEGMCCASAIAALPLSMHGRTGAQKL